MVPRWEGVPDVAFGSTKAAIRVHGGADTTVQSGRGMAIFDSFFLSAAEYLRSAVEFPRKL